MLVVPAHAKVNLALEVTGRRPDGWHEVATVIALLDWHDLVGIRLVPWGPAGGSPAPADRVQLRISGPFAEGVPADDSNLAASAATALTAQAGNPPPAVELWLCKQVPAAAGLGGGSADAAAVLRAGARLLAERWDQPPGARLLAERRDHPPGTRPTTERPAAQPAAPAAPPDTAALPRIAAELGSDVPALLAGGTLLATGRGEHLRRLPPPRTPLHLAVALAAPSSTAAAYAALTDEERRPQGRVARLADALAAHATPGPRDFGSALEPAAARATPGLADALRRLRALTPETPWHLTGSGGAAFAVAPDRAGAQALAATATAAGFTARACRTMPHPLGPLHP